MDLVKGSPRQGIVLSIIACSIAVAGAIKLDSDASRIRASEGEASTRHVSRHVIASPIFRHAEQPTAVQSEPARPPFCGTAQWQSLIDEAAERFPLPREYIHAIMRAESAGCVEMNGQPTTSRAGATGLMQLMPSVWREQRKRLHLGDDPYDPHDNILAGVAYLRELVDRYGWPGASAAYHAGPARYEEYLANARPLPAATLEYTARVARSLSDRADGASPNVIKSLARLAPEKPSNHGVFVTRASSPSSENNPLATSGNASVFVRLRRGESQAKSEAQESNDVQQP